MRKSWGPWYFYLETKNWISKKLRDFINQTLFNNWKLNFKNNLKTKNIVNPIFPYSQLSEMKHAN